MRVEIEKVGVRLARVYLPFGLSFARPFALGLCVTLFLSGCSRPHVQETVTVAPRATPMPSRATTEVDYSSAPPAVDSEMEAAGDTLAHAIVALKTRRREESLYYMNLTRTRLVRLTRRLNRSATEADATSNPARESLINELRELDAAERSARHNDYAQSGAQLVMISDELDHLNSSFIHRQN